MSSNIILSIPHSSTVLPWEDIPAPYQEQSGQAYWCWGGRQKKKKEIGDRYLKELPYMTDWYTDELFINGIGKPLVAPVSRLLCDVERLKDDMKEEMSVVGMGICYTRAHDLSVLANFKFSHKMDMIRKYYDPYHNALQNYVAESLKEHKCALILDCHSFNSSTYACDQNYYYPRPDICIGTDNRHTPKELVELLTDYFKSQNYTVRENYPYPGTIVPERYDSNDYVFSIKIDVSRHLYLEEKCGIVEKKEAEFRLLKERLHEAEKIIESFVDRMCGEYHLSGDDLLKKINAIRKMPPIRSDVELAEERARSETTIPIQP